MAKTKSNLNGTNADDGVGDVFWKGVKYYDVCKVERELKDYSDKAKIKAEIF